MRTQKQEVSNVKAEDENRILQQQHTLIGEQVMNLLGRPGGLLRVQVHKLWKDNYRVNVLTGPDVVSAIIAHSYFLVTDGDGLITAATPRITKKY
jgi:hypothetical protein